MHHGFEHILLGFRALTEDDGVSICLHTSMGGHSKTDSKSQSESIKGMAGWEV